MIFASSNDLFAAVYITESFSGRTDSVSQLSPVLTFIRIVMVLLNRHIVEDSVVVVLRVLQHRCNFITFLVRYQGEYRSATLSRIIALVLPGNTGIHYVCTKVPRDQTRNVSPSHSPPHPRISAPLH